MIKWVEDFEWYGLFTQLSVHWLNLHKLTDITTAMTLNDSLHVRSPYKLCWTLLTVLLSLGPFGHTGHFRWSGTVVNCFQQLRVSGFPTQIWVIASVTLHWLVHWN
jgi:hypothetical protein